MSKHQVFMLHNPHFVLRKETWGVLGQFILPKGSFIRNQVVCRPQHSGELQPGVGILDVMWFGHKLCGNKPSVSLLSFIISSSQMYAVL